MPKIQNVLYSAVERTRRRPTEALPSRFRKYPTPVRRAIYDVWQYCEILELTPSGVRVLQAIIAAGVDPSDPYRWIFAKKKTLAKMADVSEATLYRVLKHLATAGWLLRDQQFQLNDGTMGIAEIMVTEKLADLLGFTNEDPEVISDNTKLDEHENQQRPPSFETLLDPEPSVDLGLVKPKVKSNAEDELVERSTAIMGPAQTITKYALDCRQHILMDQLKYDMAPTATVTKYALSAPAEDSDPQTVLIDGLRDGSYMNNKVYPKASVNQPVHGPRFVRRDGRSVPVELVWLTDEKRLSYAQLFKLMRCAKTVQGQTLSAYVALRTDTLKQLPTKNDCYRYLKNLIDQQIDASYLVAQRLKNQERDEAVTLAKVLKAKRQTWMDRNHGKVFTDGSGATYTINARHGIAEIGQNGLPVSRPAQRVDSGFISRVDAGILKPFVRDDRAAPDIVSKHLEQIATLFPGLTRRSKSTSEIGI